MILDSVVLMALFDLAIIAMSVVAAATLYRYRQPVADLGLLRSALLILTGVLALAALYVADLVTMFVLPPFVGHEAAMRMMMSLHSDWIWGAVLLGVGAIVTGLVLLLREVLPGTAAHVHAMRDMNVRLQKSHDELERRFLATTNVLPVGIVIVRRSDARLLFTNEMWREMFGVESDDTGHTAIEHYADPAVRVAMLREIDARGAAGPLEIEGQRTDGTRFWALMSSTVIEFMGEAAILSGLVDITRQHDAQERLRDSERRFRAIAEATPYPMFIARRRDGRLLYANEQVRQTMGFTDDPLDHFSTEMYWDTEDRAPLLEALERDGRRLTTEVRHRTAHGTMFWAITSSVALDFEGEPAILTSFIDISDKKAAEEELSAHRDHLEELVALRASELQDAQAELLRNERLATIGQVTATVAHELRNPLGTIVTSLALLEQDRESLSPRSRTAIERIERNIQRCVRIIGELLSYTRQRPLFIEYLHVDRWLRDLMQEVQPGDGEHTLVTSLDCDAPAHFDRERLRQAVINIIENGRQSMRAKDPNERTLTLETRRSADRVEIEVRDTGVGIAEEHLDSIFEPLFSMRSFGVGLGLPLVKEIMAEHKGGIEIASELGSGTSVLLWLPAIENAPLQRPRTIGAGQHTGC